MLPERTQQIGNGINRRDLIKTGVAVALSPAGTLCPTAGAAGFRLAPKVGWLSARTNFACGSGGLPSMCFSSVLLAGPGSATLLELRYFTAGACQPRQSWAATNAGWPPPIAVQHEAILSAPGATAGNLAGLLNVSRGAARNQFAFDTSIPAPAWLAPAYLEPELWVSGVVTTCESLNDLPAELLGFARARHPWIIRDPLSWLSANRYLADWNQEY